jgi:hypothetical protein
MSRAKKRGRPREWVLNEEIIEIHKLLVELKKRNTEASLSEIKDILRIELERKKNLELLSKLDKTWGLIKQVIPFPSRCICGRGVYSYTYNEVKTESERYWEIFARCVNPNCRYLRRYLPQTSYKWSRPEPASRELENEPTNYELDGQLVEEPKK